MDFIPLLLCSESSDPVRRRFDGQLVAVGSFIGVLWGLSAFGWAALFLAAPVAFAYVLRSLAALGARRLRATLAAKSAAVVASRRESSAIIAAATSASRFRVILGLRLALDALVRWRLALPVADLNLTPRFFPIPRSSWRGWGA